MAPAASTASLARRTELREAATARRERPALPWAAIFLCALIVIQTVRVLPRLDDMILTGDSGTYIMLSEALGSGVGYRDLRTPGNPPHVHFPPGFPVLLAGLRSLGVGDVESMKRVIVLLGLSAVLAAYFLLRPRVGNTIAALVAAWMALHPDYLSVLTSVGSDAPYLLLSFTALLMAGHSARKEGWRDWEGVVCWSSAVGAAYIRSVGLALLVVLPLYLAWHKARLGMEGAPSPRGLLTGPLATRLTSLVLIGAVYLTPALAWEGWKAAHPSPGGSVSYTTLWQLRDELDWDKGEISGAADVVERYARNGRRWLRSLGGVLISGGTDRQRSLVGLGAAGLVAAGMIASLLRGYWLLEAYLVILALGTLGNPQQPLPRYLIPFLPFVLYYPALLLIRAGKHGRTSAQIAAALALIFVFTHETHAREARLHPALTEYRAAANWIGDHTNRGAVVLCRKTSLMYLWSDRKSVSFPRSRKIALMEDSIRTWGVTHVVMDGFSKLTTQFLEPWVAANRARLTLVHERGATRVFELRAGSSRIVRSDGRGSASSTSLGL